MNRRKWERTRRERREEKGQKRKDMEETSNEDRSVLSLSQ